jgi:hypothetical protein
MFAQQAVERVLFPKRSFGYDECGKNFVKLR